MILVTGGTGLTGQFVVAELLRRGQAVRVLSQAQSLDRVPDARVELAPGDLADLASLRRAMTAVSGVVHAACTFTDSAVDIAAMETLLAEWRQGPFVFVSSLDVHGFAQATPIREDHPLSETYGDYGRGKVVCEGLLRQAAARGGRTDFAILRAPYIWGPHPKARQRLVNRRLEAGQTLVLPGATEAEWAEYQDVWIDVRDLAWIIAETLERPPGGALNVLSGHFTWHDLYTELIRLTGSRSTLVHKPLAEIEEDELPNQQLYAQRWRFSDERLQEQLHFTPRYTWGETLRAVVGATG